MNEWLHIFKQSIAAEWPNRPPVGALATIDITGFPRVRHVVCPRIDHDGTIRITSDRRSHKNRDIRANPYVELAIWLPSRRQQFRIHGQMSIDSDRQSIWLQLSDETRAIFFWPGPGLPRAPAEFPTQVPSNVPPPDNFEVLVLKPFSVDLLELTAGPHRLRRWTIHTDWKVEELNP
jgi:hypothetical protein